VTVPAETEILFELNRGFPLLPGCTADTAAFFRWNGRTASAVSEYSSGRKNGSLSVKALQYGKFCSSGITIITGDAAGLFRYIFSIGEDEFLTVLPRSDNNTAVPDTANTGGDDLSRLLKKKRNDELLESRQYFPGDDVRRINWKTFAHSGELFIRIGEEKPEPQSSLLVIIDLSRNVIAGKPDGKDDIYLDYFASAAAGIFDELSVAGINTGVFVPPGPAAGAGDRLFLAGLWWNNETIPRSVFSRRGDRSCILITTPFSKNAAAVCETAYAEGISVNVIIPVPPEEPRPRKKSVPVRMLFSGQSGESVEGRRVMVDSDRLVSELKTLKGAAGVYKI